MARGNKKAVQLLVENGAELNSCNRRTCITPLCVAVQNGHQNIVAYPIDKGASVNLYFEKQSYTYHQTYDIVGCTALVDAVRGNSIPMVNLLLPVHSGASLKLLGLLIEKGADSVNNSAGDIPRIA